MLKVLLSAVQMFLPGTSMVSLVIGAVAILSPFVTYGYGVVKTKYEVRAEERAACRAQIADLQLKADQAAAKAFEEARRAADNLTPTPTAPGELARLCAGDRYCRDRSPAK